MRNLLAALGLVLLSLAGAALSSASNPAAAQSSSAGTPLSPLNCDALNKGTLICVRNALPQAILKITCSGGGLFSAGPVDLSIPHGSIRPGETTIVDFIARDRCNRHIVATTRDGHQYPFDGFDVTNNTSLLIDNQ